METIILSLVQFFMQLQAKATVTATLSTLPWTPWAIGVTVTVADSLEGSFMKKNFVYMSFC